MTGGRSSSRMIVGLHDGDSRHFALPASWLLLAAGAAWVGVVVVARHMGPMPGTMGLGLGSFIAVWALMMAAMMLPSVTPFASLYSRVLTDHRTRRLGALALGYILVWTGAALPAFALAWLADRALNGHPTATTALAAAIFAGCGLYQLTPMKDRCLARCRSPLGFLMHVGSRRGRLGGLRAGFYHGAFCLGCCWGLMALLVVFGLMNLAAMIVLAAVVMVEKAGPWGRPLSQLIGIAALALALIVVFEPHLASGLVPSSSGEMGNVMSS